MAEPLITFDLRRGRIFVGDVEELAKLLRVTSAEQATPTLSLSPGAASAGVLTDGNPLPLREFARPFAHRKLYERIALLLHYARSSGHSSITPKELSDWFGLCGFKTPVRMDKALDNVMRQRRLVERTGPGQWGLTAAGESVALDLLESSVNGDQ